MASPDSVDSPAFLDESSPGSGGPEKTGEAVPVDVVPTSPARPGRRRGYPQSLRRINEAQVVRSADLAERLRDLRLANPGWTMKRLAAELGISRVHASRLWAVWVRRANALTPEESKEKVEEVRAFLEGKLLAVLQACEAQIDVNASYAAGVLKSLEMLAKLHKVDLSGDREEAGSDTAAGEIQRITSSAHARAVSVLSALPRVDEKAGGGG